MLLEIRIATCAAMLIIAALIDLKQREIPDKIWLIFGVIGIGLTIIEFAFPYWSSNGLSMKTATTTITEGVGIASPPQQSTVLNYLFGIGLVAAIACGVYKTALFGGADSKALVVVAILLPSYDGMLFKLHSIAALTMLTNALIISMSVVVYNVIKNSVAIARGIRIFEGLDESRPRKAVAFAMGFKSTKSDYSSSYLFAMEGVDEDGKRKFTFNPSKYDDFVSDSKDVPITDGFQENIWVTHAVPFIVYLAIGFGIMIIFGDLMAPLISSIVGAR